MPINPPTQLLVNFQDNGFVLFDKRKSMVLNTIKGHRVGKTLNDPESIFVSSCIVEMKTIVFNGQIMAFCVIFWL